MNLIPKFKIVPTKSEMQTVIQNYLESPEKSLIEKYIVIKTLETFCKTALKIFDRQKVIESALTLSEGDMKFDLNNAKVQITKEKISDTVKKYQFSEGLEAKRIKYEIKIGEYKIKSDALKKEIKDLEIHEINSNIAIDISETLKGEPEPLRQGIKITLP